METIGRFQEVAVYSKKGIPPNPKIGPRDPQNRKAWNPILIVIIGILDPYPFIVPIQLLVAF